MPKPPAVPPEPAVANPFAGLQAVRAHLMAAGEELEKLIGQVPAAFREPWVAARDELLEYTSSLDVG